MRHLDPLRKTRERLSTINHTASDVNSHYIVHRYLALIWYIQSFKFSHIEYEHINRLHDLGLLVKHAVWAQIMDYQVGLHNIIIINLASRIFYIFQINLSFPSTWRQPASSRVIQFHWASCRDSETIVGLLIPDHI